MTGYVRGRHPLLASALTLIALAIFTSNLSMQTRDDRAIVNGREVVPGEILVKFRAPHTLAERTQPKKASKRFTSM